MQREQTTSGEDTSCYHSVIGGLHCHAAVVSLDDFLLRSVQSPFLRQSIRSDPLSITAMRRSERGVVAV
ncbi:hypothetical protein SKAU_G00106710 [Synaphobranchus kaupii]|uniref:Uncharacterized protein n=1 Tax=Synaphobranchus kaupii TaxID=118154 RepID=A0A9Q1FZF9_SYNKA|nr:hypothetical protein SKAU_G00106710 [Synaphobranchus kaupii]